MQTQNSRERLFDEFPPATYDQWRREAERLLMGASFRENLLFETIEGITLKPIYFPEDAEGLSRPCPLDWEAEGWTVAQEIGSPSQEGAILRVSPGSVADLGKALESADLSKKPLFLESGTSGLPCLALYMAAAKSKGVDFECLRGAVAFDPLNELLSRGEIPMPLETAFDEMAEMTALAVEQAPGFGTVWIHGEVFHDGGASAVQELGFSLAAAVEYLRALEARSVDPNEAAPHFRFSFSLGSHIFMEVAKLRAARLLWSRILKACGVGEEKRGIWIHGRTSRRAMSAYDPYVNLLRATTQAFSGVVGGADSLEVGALDECVRTPDEFSRRLARNIQLILRDEAHLKHVQDPAGGSWYVERLTLEAARSAWEIFQEVEGRGGMAEAIMEGFPQGEVERTAAERDRAAASRKDVIVGVNKYPDPLEEAVEIAERPVKGRGGSGSCVTIPVRRPAEPFERLRSAIQKRRASGGNMKVFLAALGPVAGYMPRLDFSASFFEVGGFEVIRTEGYDDPEEAAARALEENASIVVVCGRDEDYEKGAVIVAERVKASRGDACVVLAGRPRNDGLREKFTAAGVDLFIHAKSDVLEKLVDLAEKMGVKP